MNIQQYAQGTLSVTTGASVLFEGSQVARVGAVWVTNTHATGFVYLALGTTAVASNGIAVCPTQTVKIEGWNGYISAIGSTTITVSIGVGYLDKWTDTTEFNLSSSSSESSSSQSNSSLSSQSSSLSSLSSHSESSQSSSSESSVSSQSSSSQSSASSNSSSQGSSFSSQSSSSTSSSSSN